MAQARRIIQLLTNDCHKLIALCNDGTILVEARLIGDHYGWDVQDWEVPQPIRMIQGKVTKQELAHTFEMSFESIWHHNGRNGSKMKAKEIYTKMALGESSQDLTSFTSMLCDHIDSQQDIIGFNALHLTTYLNQKRWEQ